MKVQVLLSTYNGENYLKEQLDSILEQELPAGVELSILIRDDGSSDGTIGILSRYTEEHPEEVSYFLGKNVGAIKSFFHLVKSADVNADFFAFSDQDDIWHPKKVWRALTVLHREGKKEPKGLPMLYCCRPHLVDAQGEALKVGIRHQKKRPDFGNALVENIVYGCSMVVNRTLLFLVKEHIPEYTIMHDWWFYLTATAFGRVIYDDRQWFDYRQHGNNEMGTRNNYLDEFKERVSRFFGNRNHISHQLSEFLRLYEVELSEEKRGLVKKLLDGKKHLTVRGSLFLDQRIFRQRREDDIIFRLIYLTGSY